MTGFVHLHTHSDYSLLDGAQRIPALVQRARALGMPALALTDHGNLFGAIEFYKAARAASIQPILGCEAYVAIGSRLDKPRNWSDYYHLVLLVRNTTGYHNLLKLSSPPAVAEALLPDHIYACKRPCLATDYFETYNRPNVTLVDIRETGIERITPRGVIANGKEYELDCLVFATGFDAMTGSLNRINIRGRGSVALKDKWADGPKSYLGLSSAGFPNLFTITGPGSPSVLANMIPAIEQHVNWIGDCLKYMQERKLQTIEATAGAENVHGRFMCKRRRTPRCGALAIIGMSAIVALAGEIASGSLRLDPSAPVDATLAALERIPGVGPWTAQYIAMRALAWPDAFPHPDVAVLKAMRERDARRARERAEAWRPWRSYAVLHLWKSLEKTPRKEPT